MVHSSLFTKIEVSYIIFLNMHQPDKRIKIILNTDNIIDDIYRDV